MYKIINQISVILCYLMTLYRLLRDDDESISEYMSLSKSVPGKYLYELCQNNISKAGMGPAYKGFR